MRILLASSEAHPFSKTGGLADMVGALGKFLAQAGEEVAILTPLYGSVPREGLQPANAALEIPLGDEIWWARLHELRLGPRLTVYFVEQERFYNRPGVYGEKGKDYPDNAARFIYFSKCVALFARESWRPEVAHLHDWQTGLAALYIWDQRHRLGWTHHPAVCFTVHNLAYQGVFPPELYRLTNLPSDYYHPEGVEFFSQFNCLKAGLAYADGLTTVSPTYANEICAPEAGCALDGILRSRQADLAGILNGVDYSEWRTEGNPHLRHGFSLENLEPKKEEKLELQRELGLPARLEAPLFGSVTRLADQKGIDVMLAAIEELIGSDLQWVALGSGASEYEQALRRLQERHPEKVAARIGFDRGLAHRIEAGADFFVMPSRFEPCGLNQMYSLRYGAIPIVRATGGLDDTVVDATENEEEADGIKFYEYSPRALVKAIRKAMILFQHPEAMRLFRENGMSRDFSWEHTAAAYQQVYRRLRAGEAITTTSPSDTDVG